MTGAPAATQIRYVTGDATAPEGNGPKIIAHVCNDVGGWGAGFVLAVSRRWQAPELAYRNWFDATRSGATDYPLRLGHVIYIAVEKPVVVANMVAQQGFGSRDHPPLRYDELRVCLDDVARYCLGERGGHPDTRTGARFAGLRPSVHMPRIGCGLAGGNWEDVSAIVREQLCARGIEVTVYDFAGPD